MVCFHWKRFTEVLSIQFLYPNFDQLFTLQIFLHIHRVVKSRPLLAFTAVLSINTGRHDFKVDRSRKCHRIRPKVALRSAVLTEVICGHFGYRHFQQVLAIWFDQIGDVILETVKTPWCTGPASLPLMSTLVSVMEPSNTMNTLFVCPVSRKKFIFVKSLFACFILVVTIVVSSKALQLPVGWHGNLCPLPHFFFRGTVKIPLNGMVLSVPERYLIIVCWENELKQTSESNNCSNIFFIGIFGLIMRMVKNSSYTLTRLITPERQKKNISN